jgi:hypothetical protein
LGRGRAVAAGREEAAVTTDRIRAHTPSCINERIDDAARGLLQRYRISGDRDAVVRRLAELDREWDVDRALMALFPAVGSVVLELGLTRGRGWLNLLRAQLGFLAWHAAVGWCPPVSVLRRLGFRTRPEIEAERDALRAMIARPSAPSPGPPALRATRHRAPQAGAES